MGSAFTSFANCLILPIRYCYGYVEYNDEEDDSQSEIHGNDTSSEGDGDKDEKVIKDRTISDKEFESFYQDITKSGNVRKLILQNCSIEISKKFKMKQTNKRDLYSVCIKECKFSNNSLVNMCLSINGLTTLDLSNNSISKEDARIICNDLKDLDFIYMYNNKEDLSKVKAQNLIC